MFTLYVLKKSKNKNKKQKRFQTPPKLMKRETKDFTQVKCLKAEDSKVSVKEEEIGGKLKSRRH